MKHHRAFLGLVLSLALLALGAAPSAAQDSEAAAEPTVEGLIEKNLEAKGGREKLEAVESARLTGTMNMGGMEAPFVLEWKDPDKTRMEITIQGMTLIQAYDGETAWMLNPFMGQAAPEKMSEEDTDAFKDQADFHGPLLNPGEKGYEIEYAGEEDVEGTPTYKLKVVKPSGEETYLFLDQDYYLEIKSTSKRTSRGQEIQIETAIGDYKEVEGLMMAHSLDAIQAGGQGGPGAGFNMTIAETVLNPEIADDRFEMPEEAPAEEPAGDGR
jgi:outer membrane lipoprotein-sorting protein